MPFPEDEPVCPKFQPNIFDPLRCHDCLRQKHLHGGLGGTGTGGDGAEKVTANQKSAVADVHVGTAGSGEGVGGEKKGVMLTPICSQPEEKDSSCKEDSDCVSVVSSYCDVYGGRPGYSDSSLCILSPDCELYICDGDDDDSTDSCRDHSDYHEFSGSVSGEDDYLPIRHRSTRLAMTRLDPPPHRPNPRAWMEEARSRDSFAGRSGIKEDRDKRESGYFSVGRAAGARMLHDNSPPAPYRHFERGHPVFSTRNIEPKDTVPFRNPNLGVASDRLIPEPLEDDLLDEIPPPDPYEIAVEVEAQVGPRTPSPTPFKIAESLAATSRKGFSASHSRANPSSQVSSGRFDSSKLSSALQSRSSSPTRGNLPFRRTESATSLNRHSRANPSSQVSSGRFDSSKLSSALQSRSSSPTRGNLPFRRTESATSLNRHNFSSGAPRTEMGSRTSLQSTNTRNFASGTLPRNFKSLAGSVNSQSGTVSDFRSALKKSQANGSSSFQSHNSRSSSPSRGDYNSTQRPMSLRKTETSSSTLTRGRDSQTHSPSRRTTERRHESPSPSPPRRNYSSPSQSRLYKSESLMSLNGRSHYGRCGSPIREGYDIESQALMRNSIARKEINDQDDEQERPAMSPPRRDRDAPRQSILRKTESNPVGRGRESRTSSPGRRSYENSNPYQLRKTDTSASLTTRGRESRNSSPSRRDYENSNSYQLRKTDTNASLTGRGHESRNSSPSRRSYENSNSFQLRKTDTSNSLTGRGHESRNSSPSRRSYEAPSHSLLRKAEGNGSVRSRDNQSVSPSRKSYEVSDRNSSWKTQTNSTKHTSHNSLPSRNGNSDPPGYSVLKNATNGDSIRSLQRKNPHNDSPSDSIHSPRSWRGSTPSVRSSSVSRAASPTRQTSDRGRAAFATMDVPRNPSGIRSGVARHDSPHERRPSHSTRSPSPSPQIQIQRYTSSQSSMESSESGQLSAASAGRNKAEYATMADLPKVKRIQAEEPVHVGHPPAQNPPRRLELFKPASHSVSKHPYREWDDSVDTGSGYLSRAHSTTSLQRSGSPTADEAHRLEHMQPDLLNFKKGWMSKLDGSGEWKKHWFVLTDAGLKYYRDSSAEEKDDMDGEIDLKSCVKVSEFDVEKNYGFQIQTREAVFTLSAMTAGIRRNWIEVLKKCIRPSSSPDLTQLPDSGSDKENSHSRFLLSSRRPSSTLRHNDVHLDLPASAPTGHRRFDYVELSPVPAASSPLPANQREAGEGQGLEERNANSQWEALLSRKGSGTGSNQRLHADNEIERKWAEFERMPLKERSSSVPAVSRPSGPSANEALQREVASLRQQLEDLRRGVRGGGGDGEARMVSACGPEASCGRSLASMERAHRAALEELQRQHERQLRELETEKQRLLLEETQDTARVMEALRKKHKEDLEKEVEKVRKLSGGALDSQTLRAQQQSETQSLQRELSGLSERYSQKCLELNRAEQSNAEREREISRKERDMEQLRKENQGLKARLSEEISRLQSSVAAQGSKDKKDRTLSELEVLLRVKENEIEYLHKEISCLRNELQFLNREKRSACERYSEVQEELSGMKGRNERELQSLREHLRLAMAALTEGQKLSNSLDH